MTTICEPANGFRVACKPPVLSHWGRYIALCAYLGCLPYTGALAQEEEDKILRALLEDMAKQQYSVLCASPEFVQCMGFSSAECNDLAQAAIKQCLLPLPEEISLADLDNAALESCPQKVFADAGFSEQMAKQCFDEAIQDDKDS